MCTFPYSLGTFSIFNVPDPVLTTPEINKKEMRGLQMKRVSKLAVVVAMLIVLVTVLGSISIAADGPIVAKNATEARNAVVPIYLMYKDENNKEYYLKGGTAFFISTEHVVTCYHVSCLTAEEVRDIIDDDIFFTFNKDVFEKNYESKTFCRIFFNRDVPVDAKTTAAKSEMNDFAALKLDFPLNGTTVLPLGSNDYIEDLTPVTALGFPDAANTSDQSKINTSDDVTLTQGAVGKMEVVQGTKYFVHGAKVSDGTSGGPVIVEKDGGISVVGMIAGTALFDDAYSYALCIDDIRSTLDKVGIPYTKFDDAATETTAANDETESAETAHVHSYGEWTVTKEPAVGVPGEEERVCSECGEKETRAIDALPQPEGNNLVLYIIIGAAVLVVIIVVVLVLVLTGKKKNTQPVPPAGNGGFPGGAPGFTPGGAPNNQPPQAPPAPQFRPPVPPAGDPGGTSVLGDNGGTTVLSGAGATTVLSAQPSAFIIRKKNGEKVPISGSEFVIGKDRRRVNYCIDDNTSVSRAHAKIINRNGSFYISDMNSTNFTFVNGVKVSAGQEQAIKSGDKIKLADEEFDFTI